MHEGRDALDVAAQIDRLQRRRLLLSSVSAVAFLTWITVRFWSTATPGAERAGDMVCNIAFLIWVGTLAGMLSARGGLMRHHVIRAALNDELTVAHRKTSLLIGYWLLVAALSVVYVWSYFASVAARNVVPLLLGIAVAVPMLCFVILERRSEPDD